MSTSSAGLRPVLLPPTLQPHAIASMAPPASRGLSALMAFGIYAAMGGAGLLAVHLVPARLLEPNGPIVTINPGKIIEGSIGNQNGSVHPSQPRPDTRPLVSDPVTSTSPENSIPAETPSRLPLLPQTGNGGAETHGTSGGENTDGKNGQTGGTPSTTGAGTGPLTQSFSMAQIQILSQVQPTYPALARMAHIQGAVVLRMTIDTQGVPTDVQVTSGHPAFHGEAMRAARLWRFAPATVNGQATPATFQLTIVFSLK